MQVRTVGMARGRLLSLPLPLRLETKVPLAQARVLQQQAPPQQPCCRRSESTGPAGGSAGKSSVPPPALTPPSDARGKRTRGPVGGSPGDAVGPGGSSTGGSGAGAGSSAAPPAASTDGTAASGARDGVDAGQAQKKKWVSKRATKREQGKRKQDHIIDRLAMHANVWLLRSADGKLKVPVAIQFTRQDDKTKSFAMANAALCAP
jgi:hypothetical protein